MGELSLPRSDARVRQIAGLVCAVTASFLLIPAGLLLLVVAMLLSTPDPYTGEETSTRVVALTTISGAALMLTCAPVIYLCARSRLGAGALVTALGLGGFIATLLLLA